MLAGINNIESETPDGRRVKTRGYVYYGIHWATNKPGKPRQGCHGRVGNLSRTVFFMSVASDRAQ